MEARWRMQGNMEWEWEVRPRWTPGVAVHASINIRHFNAVIDMISDDVQTCTVTFDGYGTTEIVRVDDLLPREWEAPKISVEKQKAQSSRCV